MQNKYIIINVLGQETPILFPETMSHSTVAYTLGLGTEPVSAGFWMALVDPDENGAGVRYKAYGESYTLKLMSRPEDTDILNRFFNPLY